MQTCDIDRKKFPERAILYNKPQKLYKKSRTGNMLHCNKMYLIMYKSLTPIRRNPMFDFTKQTKQYEELAQRIKEVNEFWINSIFSSAKEFFKVK